MLFFIIIKNISTSHQKLIKSSQQRSIDSKGIPKQSESVEAPRDKKQRDQIQIKYLSLAFLQDRLALFLIYFTYLI
jgi:hypothetical protein